MGSEKWTDKRFGKRVKAKRDARGWSQADMAKMLSDRGIHPMHPTTVAKIEAGDRSVRINEAVGIADLFEVSVDSLLGRKPGAQGSELTYRLREFLDTARQSCQQVWAIMETTREQLKELPTESDSAEKLQKMGYDICRNHLDPAHEALTRLAIASDFLLDHEQRRLEPSAEALMELEVREDETQS
jgi:transcriptional regulator with XRE-family HTH domain